MDSGPQTPSRPRPRRWVPLVVAGLVVVDLLAVVAVAAHQTRGQRAPAPPHEGAHARGVVSAATGSPPAGPGTASAAGQRDRAIRGLLAGREQALRRGRRADFLATVDPADQGLRREQRRLFGNLARMPLAVWDYRAVGAAERATGAADGPGSTVWTQRVKLRYQFSGFDERAVTTIRDIRFTRTSRGWRVTDVAARDSPEIWDMGRLRVVRDGPVLVLGLGASRSRLRDIAGRMERAVPAVSGVWGSDWSRRAVVLVPRTQRQARLLSPEQGSLDQITAVATVAQGPEGAPPPGTGDRVIVNPATYGQLSDVGRRVVLRHELTHVATRAETGPGVPMWLVEGLADYVGYRDSGLEPHVVARELGVAVRAGSAPQRLPVSEDFDSDAKHLARSYEAAWMACTMIAQRHGERHLVRLYRSLGPDREGSESTGHGVHGGSMREVLGVAPDEFVSDWRSYVRRRLG